MAALEDVFVRRTFKTLMHYVIVLYKSTFTYLHTRTLRKNCLSL